MDQHIDAITISKCPKCGESHTYRFIVKRATALSASERESQSTERRLTRLFTCPVTKEDFQADLVIYAGHDEMIVSLQIVGITIEGSKD